MILTEHNLVAALAEAEGRSLHPVAYLRMARAVLALAALSNRPEAYTEAEALRDEWRARTDAANPLSARLSDVDKADALITGDRLAAAVSRLADGAPYGWNEGIDAAAAVLRQMAAENDKTRIQTGRLAAASHGDQQDQLRISADVFAALRDECNGAYERVRALRRDGVSE